MGAETWGWALMRSFSFAGLTVGTFACECIIECIILVAMRHAIFLGSSLVFLDSFPLFPDGIPFV